jgi:RTX calcium-binding nonapeptide repeat (4 copies)
VSGRVYVRGMARLPLLFLVLFGLAAAPANATLLVRSDGAGLLIQDKNGLEDSVFLGKTSRDGQTVYNIENRNSTDFFKFDRQSGCFEGDFGFMAECIRNGPVISVILAGGNDAFGIGDIPTGQSSIAAGTGNDIVNGHAGRDQPNGQSGEDSLSGLGGNDVLRGGADFDRLFGGSGNDTLRGEDGNDVLRGNTGVDEHSGGDGNDFIESREPEGTTASADTVICGLGSDSAEADLQDLVSGTCEAQDIGAVGETPNVRLPGRALRVSSGGRVRVRLRCPRGVRRLGCRGRLQLRLGRRAGSSRSRRVRYRIRAGRRKTVTLKLTRRDVRSIRRRGRRARGVLTSTERGRLGRKTTIRNPRLRLR